MKMVFSFLWSFILEVFDMKFRIVLEPSDEGGYTVTVPALPGCISEGDTLEEAVRNIKEAIELYLEEEEPAAISDTAHVMEVVL